MKKALVFFLVSIATFSTFAQGIKFGIQIAPQISLNRIKDQVQNFDVTNNGSGLAFSAGPVIDLFLMDNVAVSGGIWFASKRAAVSFLQNTVGSSSVVPEYSLQYVQLPISIKMYVNEIAGKWKPYVQVGTTLEIQVGEKFGNEIAEEIVLTAREDFSKFYDLGLILAIGTEMKIFNSNSVFAALTYNRGFLNIMRSDFQEEAAKQASVDGNSNLVDGDVLKFKNDAFGIMFGFKF